MDYHTLDHPISVKSVASSGYIWPSIKKRRLELYLKITCINIYRNQILLLNLGDLIKLDMFHSFKNVD